MPGIITMNAAASLSLVALIALLGIAGAVYEDVDYLVPGGGGGDADGDVADDSLPMADKRYYISPSCRHCMHNPSDYSACAACYSRPGAPAPYYGFRKRAFDDLYAFLPQQYDSRLAKRGSFLACKCCMSLARDSCCNRCGFRPGKRGYETSFVGVDSMGSCSCCDPAVFDFSCCMRCNRRK